MLYVVGSCVCDYGVYETYQDKQGKPQKKLRLICNSLSNAELIAEIMNTDLHHKKYESKTESEE